MSQSGVYGSYLENTVIEKLFDYDLGHGVSATQILLEANEQNIPIYAITKDNINTVLPLLAVSNDVKTDIINGVHAGQQAIVPQREIKHGNWQGSGYIIQDSITGAGAYLLEGGINGGALEGFPCEASKNAMATLVAATMQAIDLYYSMVSMVSLGSFAAANAAFVALRSLLVTIRSMLKALLKKQIKKSGLKSVKNVKGVTHVNVIKRRRKKPVKVTVVNMNANRNFN